MRGVVHQRTTAGVRDGLQSAHEPRDLTGMVFNIVGHRGVFLRVIVDKVRDALVHLVTDGGGAELRRRHLSQR